MNDDQEYKLFRAWGWRLDRDGRRWVAPRNDATMTFEEAIRCRAQPDGDTVLMAFIIQNGEPGPLDRRAEES